MTSTEALITRVLNWVALAIAAILLLVVLADIFKRQLFSDTPFNPQAYTFDDLPGQGGKVMSANVEPIIEQHVFGKKAEAPPKQVVVEKPVEEKPPPPRAKLNVKLSGIIEGSSPNNGLAMLDTGKGSQVLSVGEEFGDSGAVLKAVHPSYVVFDRDGHEENVEMKRDELQLNAPLPKVDLSAKRGGSSSTASLPTASAGFTQAPPPVPVTTQAQPAQAQAQAQAQPKVQQPQKKRTAGNREAAMEEFKRTGKLPVPSALRDL